MSLSSPNSPQRSQSILHQQARLFRHLSVLLCQLCERITWSELESGDKRRLKRVLAGLSTELHGAQGAMKPQRSRSQCRQSPTRQTTKAASRKR